jgi:hypothetical protein
VIITDFGSQFVNQVLFHFNKMTGIKHHTTIPYSKEENGIVERANKEVNRHIRNILFDKGHFKYWTRYLCMTERILNSSIKQPLGVSPNTLLFGAAFPTDSTLLGDIDRPPDEQKTRSIRDYVDELVDRQSRLIEAAIQSQVAVNEDNLRKRYAQYRKLPKLRQRTRDATTDDMVTSPPASIAHMFPQPEPVKPPVIAAVKWVPYRTDPDTGDVLEYIRLIEPERDTVDTVEEIDTNPYLLTTYAVNDYVLRRYPPSKVGGGNPHKYGSWWRGPYQVSHVLQKPVSGGSSKPIYTIRNLTNGKESVVDVTHLRPFYYDPAYVTPLNVAAKDTDEEVVEKILDHDFADGHDKKWLVKWSGDTLPAETWERYDTLKDVEVFQHYCATWHLDPFPPKATPRFSASMPNMHRLHGGPRAAPTPPVNNLPSDPAPPLRPVEPSYCISDISQGFLQAPLAPADSVMNDVRRRPTAMEVTEAAEHDRRRRRGRPRKRPAPLDSP